MNEKMMGDAVLDGIIKHGLCHAESCGVIVWSASAPEVIELIITEYMKGSEDQQRKEL